MKLEVGMYVRTNKGIFQIRNKDVFIEDKKQYIGVNGRYTCIDIETIIKASHNIIDLVQENDFVNGEKVSSIQYDGMGFEHIRCVQTICKFDDLDNRFYTETYFNKDIKSIVTKEQFEAMQYEIK